MASRIFLKGLERCREQREMSVRELEAASDISAGTIYRIERGRSCNARTARRLRDALGATVEDMQAELPF